MKLLLFFGILFSTTLLADEIKTYENCFYQAHDFTQNIRGEHVFDCDSQELRLQAYSPLIEDLFKEHLVKRRTARGFYNYKIITSTNMFNFEQIVGFKSHEIVEFQHLTFDRKTRELRDLGGELVMTLTEEQLQGSQNSVPSLPSSRFGNNITIIDTNGHFRDARIERVENCFPKSCGISILIYL